MSMPGMSSAICPLLTRKHRASGYWPRTYSAVNAAAVITTVSRRYAQEIQTPAFGFGFDGILRARAGSLVGILNGIDVKEWNPADDPFLQRLATRTCLERVGAPHELAGALLFLASDASTYVNGQIIYVDGGMIAAM